MQVLVYGHAGWIGGQFVEVLKKNNITYILGTARVDDLPSLCQELDDSLPSHVVSFMEELTEKLAKRFIQRLTI